MPAASVDVPCADYDESITTRSDTPTGIDELFGGPSHVQYQDCTDESDGKPTAKQPAFGKPPSNQRAAIGDQAQSASSSDTTSTSSSDDYAAVFTTAVKEDWRDELFCNDDSPSFLEDSATALLRAKAKDLVPVAAPNLALKRLDICNWVYKQCQARHAPVTTTFITMQLFDTARGCHCLPRALLLVSSLSVALKHDQRSCSLCTSDCALLASRNFLNSQKHTYLPKDVIGMELAVLFETKFTFLATPIAAAECWATVIGFDCRIGDSSSEAGARMQQTFLKLVAMDSIPPNLPAGALGGAVVLAELYRAGPASGSDTDERVALLLQKMSELYSLRDRENATAMLIAAEDHATFEQPRSAPDATPILIAAENRATFKQPRSAPLLQHPQTCGALGCAIS